MPQWPPRLVLSVILAAVVAVLPFMTAWFFCFIFEVGSTSKVGLELTTLR